MSVLPDLLPIVLDMMDKRMTGTINLTNPGLITHNEILEMFTEIVDPSFKWSNFSIEEQNILKKLLYKHLLNIIIYIYNKCIFAQVVRIHLI
jgi:hypothetical protein